MFQRRTHFVRSPALIVAAPLFLLSQVDFARAENASGQNVPGRHAEREPIPIDTSSTGQPEKPTDPYVPRSRGRTQRQIIQFGGYTSIQVNVDEFGNNINSDAANEPSIAVDPTNPNRIAIGWRQFDHVSSNFRQAGYSFSTDGGRTWQRVEVIQPGFFRSDPVLGASPEGVFYYMSLQSSFYCDLFRSTDGGQSWPERYSAYGGDKQWFTVDYTGNPSRGNMYMSWSSNAACCSTRIFTRSFDEGATWMNPITIPNRMIFGTQAVGPEGEVYVCGVNPSNFAEFRVARSSNAHDPAVTPTFDFSNIVNLGGSLRFSTGPNPGGLLGQPWIAVDTSGGREHGSIYICGSVDPSGADNLDIRIVKSHDGGVTWTPSRKINDDNSTLHWQWFGTMSLAPNGRIDAIWNDTRNNAYTYRSQVFYSSSTNGGVSWSPNVALTSGFQPGVGYPNQNKIGDYYHMVSDNVGASLAYAATFNNEQDVYFIRIGEYDCNVNGVGDAADIAGGDSSDFNANAIPDECEGMADLDCDGALTFADVEAFVMLVLMPADYAATFPDCDEGRADIDASGMIDGLDVYGFVRLLARPL